MGPLSSLQVVKFSRVAISNSKKNVERGRVLIEPLWLRDVAIDKQQRHCLTVAVQQYVERATVIAV